MSKPFWDACNEGRLVMQTCTACNLIHYPPKPECDNCGSGNNMEWREVSGRGKVHGYGVMYDCRVRSLQEDQPFNIALVELEEDPLVTIYSHLPGTPLDEVPVGASVREEFEETGTGQKVPEWRVVS